MTNKKKIKQANKTSTPNVADDEFILEKYEVKLIKPSNLKTITDLTFNETALKLLLLKIETDLENYTLARISLLRKSIDNQATEALETARKESVTALKKSKPLTNFVRPTSKDDDIL